MPVRDLGEHRLKDLSRLQRLYQLGGDEFPPLKTLHQTNLPVQPNPLVGRARELADVTSFLRSGTRLLTLTGAGGSGKTRLALHAAALVADEFPDGVWFVSFAPIVDPAFFEPSIAEVVGVRGDVVEELRSRRLLLLLDNLEQVRDISSAVARLLGEAPGVRVLATSRERLGVSIEQEYPVPTLPVEAAVELFVERARLLRPDFEADALVGDIARRVNGLPLAVELAAARVKVLTPSQILDRLGQSLDLLGGGARDLPERQRTLRATIEWSYQLLSLAERELFERLAVFAGSFDLEAAEAIAEADLDTLTAIVDKSLVRQAGEGRFLMLQVLREYAAERLVASGRAAELALKHASYYRAVAVQAEPELHSARQSETLDSLDAEHTNIRRAIEWALDAAEWELVLTLVGKLFRYWDVRGYVAEGHLLVERSLAAAPSEPTLGRADALFAASFLSHRMGGDPELRRSRAEEALEIYVKLDDPVGAGRTLNNLAAACLDLGKLAESKALFERALVETRAARDYYYVVMVTSNLADLALRERDFIAAADLAEQAIATTRAHDLGLADVEALALCNRAHALVRLEDPAAADSARAAIKLSAQLGFLAAVCAALITLAAALARAEPETAAKLLGAADGLLESLENARLEPAEARLYDDTRAKLAEALGLDRYENARAHGQTFDYEAAVLYALETVDDSRAGQRAE
jgi:predicted ATPase